MRAGVKRIRDTGEYETSERCHIQEVANDAGDEWVSVARARVAPGTITAWHQLAGITERYIIVRGRGRVHIGDLPPVEIGEGDVARIPADTPQRIENIGSGDLIFFAVCAPPFQQSCYIALE